MPLSTAQQIFAITTGTHNTSPINLILIQTVFFGTNQIPIFGLLLSSRIWVGNGDHCAPLYMSPYRINSMTIITLVSVPDDSNSIFSHNDTQTSLLGLISCTVSATFYIGYDTHKQTGAVNSLNKSCLQIQAHQRAMPRPLPFHRDHLSRSSVLGPCRTARAPWSTAAGAGGVRLGNVGII